MLVKLFVFIFVIALVLLFIPTIFQIVTARPSKI